MGSTTEPLAGKLAVHEMPRNEEGEFELVLGNRQLLSVFFIIVILMGVCLTMGYVLGRNAGPAPAGAKAKATTIVVDPSLPETAQAAPVGMQPGEVQVKMPAAPVSAPPLEHAAETVQAPPPAAASKPPEAAKPAPMPEKKAEAPAPAAQPAPAGALQEPAPGSTFLQVAAARRSDAEVLAGELRRKGFPVQLAPGPQELVRVLVGPLPDAAERVKTRGRLKDEAGLDSFVKTYR